MYALKMDELYCTVVMFRYNYNLNKFDFERSNEMFSGSLKICYSNFTI